MSFEGIVGHRRLLDLLSRAIARDSLTPSLILSGPEGVGKRLTAIAIAQELNRPSTTDHGPSPRDQGPLMRRIASGQHPDVQIIEPGETGTIKIEQVRAAIERSVYRPFEGRKRVTIVDQADALVPAAQNALLKTLEEPPSASVFILVTSRPDVLLPTVRSRCAQLRFGRLEVADVARILEERHRYSRADAVAAAAGSGGSVGYALAMDAGGLVEARTDAERLLRAAGRDARTRLDTAKDLLKGGGSAPSEREHLGARLEAFGSLVRDMGLLSSGADAGFLVNPDRRKALEPIARSYDADRMQKAFDAVTRAQEALQGNVSPKVVADWLAIQL